MRGNPSLEVSLTHVASQDHSELLRAAMATSQWRQPDLRLNRTPSDAGDPGVAQEFDSQDSDRWNDPLLAEIEDLVAALKAKVARYSLLRSDPSLTGPSLTGPALTGASHPGASHPDNKTATDWMYEALEDIAATALGIELASQERIFRAISDAGRSPRVETNPIKTTKEPKSGNAA
ncbi:hypothetical protein [Arthrobacter sp. UNC362MFTsu5.1]|jgi:hypothetical protein|uniref:hypothetical protein n=1 Tax=Arthrobacter sp. UNC362MFTsu5.1 TaxID=1449044 RepID=UPI000482B5E9|nr:hypothetical protein [Arthrobacter sp. UNC362MFTsu5.1]